MNLLAALPNILGAGWSGGGHAGGWWPVIPLFWIAIVGLAIWFGTRRRPAEPSPLTRATELLAERYARGEVSTDEYRERLGNLR